MKTTKKNKILDKQNETLQTDKIIEQLAKIPNASEFENKKVTNSANWFNQNLIVFLTILFACLGILLIVLVLILI